MQMEIRNWYSKKLIMLYKIYKDNDKLSGKDDNFSFKVTIFLDKYRQVDLRGNSYI